MKRPILIALIALSAAGSNAQAASWRRVLRITQAALLASTAADAASSYGQRELDPVLGRGRYGVRQASLEFGITGAMLAAQQILVHYKPFLAKRLAIVNMVRVGAFTGLAVYNEHLRSN
ncbi:MAG TPA: hypothetical protein VN924_14055 [Bryobacteraceae bacterium]|nr:hypothetical protein [Bryobacteraceae bacterium]